MRRKSTALPRSVTDWYSVNEDSLLNQIVPKRGQKAYPVTWKNDRAGCPDQEGLVHVKEVHHFNSDIRDSFMCTNSTITLTSHDTDGVAWWNTGDTAHTLRVPLSGLYALSVQKDICLFQDTAVINYVPGVTVDMPDVKHCFEDGPLELSAETRLPKLWSTGDTSQIVNITDSGAYWLQVTKQFCNDVDTFHVSPYCKPTFFMPNAFTPNGDAINPEFLTKGDRISEFEMTIFSRNGGILFYTNHMEEGWDGRVKGEIAPVGKYYYVIRYSDNEGAEHQQNGQFALIK